ncbi:hypothetical protein [Kitasatospora sp. NPDC059571]|uniref:hypothetical protein n=1 Tax=Kitasatospora sp. NPDC059571 TaxID=3346871 RepID=UPI00368A4F6F
MHRGLKRTAVLLAVAGAACLPAASAAATPQQRIIVIGDNNQVAGDDIFNAGHDNTVGSNDGGSSTARGWLDIDAVASAVTRHYLG